MAPGLFRSSRTHANHTERAVMSARFKSSMTVILYVGVCALGLTMALHPVLQSGFRLTPGDPGDASFCHYIMEHGWQWLSGNPLHSRFWDAPFYYPAKGVTAYSVVLVSAAIPYWVARALHIAPDLAWSLSLACNFTLNFGSAALLLRRGLHIGNAGAAAGAFIFAFAAPRTNQLLHPQLLVQYWGVLALYGLVRLVALRRRELLAIDNDKQAWGYAALTCFGFVGQLYADYYTAWFLGFGILLVGLSGVFFQNSRRQLLNLLRRDGKRFVACAVLAGLALWPLASHYLEVARLFGFRAFDKVSFHLARPASWFNIGPSHWLYGWTAAFPSFSSLPAEHEHRIGFGYITPLLAAIGLWRARRRYAWVLPCIVGIAALIFLSTKWGPGFNPWHAVYYFAPGARAIRAMARIGEVLLLPAAIGVAALIDSFPVSRFKWLFLAPLCGFAALEQGVTVSTFDTGQHRRLIESIAEAVPSRCSSFYFAAIKGKQGPPNYHVASMWAGSLRQIPTINGYSGYAPPGYPLSWFPVTSPEQGEGVRDALDRWRAQNALSASTTCLIAFEPQDDPQMGPRAP